MQNSPRYILAALALMAAVQVTKQQNCLTTLDIIFCVDGSNSMGDVNFERLEYSLISLVRKLNMSEEDVRCGMVLYSRTINAIIPLTGNKEDFIKQIMSLQYPDEETATDAAIDTAVEMLKNSGRRSKVPWLTMAITDGLSNNPELTRIAAAKAKNLGIIMIAVGVSSSINEQELNDIASSPDKVYITEDFTTLEATLNNATYRVCVDLQCQDAMIDITFVLDQSKVIGEDNFSEMKNFVRDFLAFADVSKIRIALVTFNDVASVQFNLNTHSTKIALYSAVSSLQYKPGSANLGDALQILRTAVYTRVAGNRPDVPNVVIVLSVDDVNVDVKRAIAEADTTRGASIQIYGIGIGHKNASLLDGIVSRPTVENKFMINSFSQLQMLIGSVYEQFNKFCQTPPPVPACFMGQTDLWLVVDLSKTSETLSRAQSTGDFQTLKNGLSKMIDIILDPSVANPGVRLGLITYSDTVKIVSDISQSGSVSKTDTAVANIPGDISQGGSSLVAALRAIATPPIVSNYRSYVAIVAPESAFLSDTKVIQSELARLKGINYTVVIFAIRESGTLDQQTLQTAASGSRFVYYIPSYTQLEAASKNFTRDRLCNGLISNSSGLCAASGHRESGVGAVPHPSDCDKYIQCYYDERNDLDIGVVRYCPVGLFWNDVNQTCTSPSVAGCAYDRCKEGCSEMNIEGICGAYWSCEDGSSMLQCCQQNYSFVMGQGCQHDVTCTDQCGPKKWCGKCQKKPNWQQPAGYDVVFVGGEEWMPRPCFYMDFDIVDCDCTVQRDQSCPADREYDFTDAQTIMSINEGTEEGIRVSDVVTDSEGISLGLQSAVHVTVDKATSTNQRFTVEFRFRESDTFSPYGETLISSGVNCGTSGSLLVSAIDGFIFADIKSSDGHVSMIKLPTQGLNKDEFKDLVLTYDNENLALSIKDEQIQYIAKAKAPPNICFSCGLDIGRALNKHSFIGEVQKIAVYSCPWELLY